MTKVLITGATGFVGSYTARLLVNAGLEVYAIKRATSRMDMVADIQDRIQWHTCDLTEVYDLDEVVSKVDSIIHCAALISFDPKKKKDLYTYNVEATRDLVNLALSNKVQRLIMVSSIAALGRYSQEPNKPIDESIEWSDGLDHSYYGITKHLAEQEVWRGQAEGLDTLILNPSLVIGAGYWDSGTPAIFKRVAGFNPFYPKGSTGVVDVRDVADLLYKALISDISGERIIVSGDNLTYRALLEEIAGSLGKKAPSTGLNSLLINTLTALDLIRATVLRQPRLVTKDNLRASARDSSYKTDKSKSLLKHTYRSISSTIKATANSFITTNKEGLKHGILPFD